MTKFRFIKKSRKHVMRVATNSGSSAKCKSVSGGLHEAT